MYNELATTLFCLLPEETTYTSHHIVSRQSTYNQNFYSGPKFLTHSENFGPGGPFCRDQNSGDRPTIHGKIDRGNIRKSSLIKLDTGVHVLAIAIFYTTGTC